MTSTTPPSTVVRFRHASGDILLPCSLTARMSEIKAALCAEWPSGKRRLREREREKEKRSEREREREASKDAKKKL